MNNSINKKRKDRFLRISFKLLISDVSIKSVIRAINRVNKGMINVLILTVPFHLLFFFSVKTLKRSPTPTTISTIFQRSPPRLIFIKG